MHECKILTLNDARMVPEYINLLYDAVGKIVHFYDKDILSQITGYYTPDSVIADIKSGNKRHIAHLSNNNLDGLLIEGFDTVGTRSFPLNRTLIRWVVAKYEGQGIGSRLVTNCVQRAVIEGKDVISLVVARENSRAIRLYDHLGFVQDKKHAKSNDNMDLMHYTISTRIK